MEVIFAFFQENGGMIRQVDYETVKSNRHTIMTATDPSMI
jgi:hypothetical protein